MNSIIVLVIVFSVLSILGGIVTIPGGILVFPPFAYFYWTQFPANAPVSNQFGPLGSCPYISTPWQIISNWQNIQQSCSVLFIPNVTVAGNLSQTNQIVVFVLMVVGVLSQIASLFFYKKRGFSISIHLFSFATFATGKLFFYLKALFTAGTF